MSDLHDRLQRLRQAGRLRSPIAPGAVPIEPPVKAIAPEQALAAAPIHPFADLDQIFDLADLPGMERMKGAGGDFLLRTTRFELAHQQGSVRLADLLTLPPGVSAQAGRDPNLANLDFRQVVFLDTETSGLAGGTGVIVFLTGVGMFEDGEYVVRQYFARNPAEEPAYLPHLAENLHRAAGMVSFNGRAFDLPLLRTRFLLFGVRPPPARLPHLDLLHPARRLWRGRLGACNFGHLETNVLGHRRTGLDVPSWLIPNLWFRYARGEGNVSDMAGVLYHNLEDIVSMAPLAHVLCGTLAGVLEPHPGDLLALAKDYARQGKEVEAERAFRQALDLPLSPDQRLEAAMDLAMCLKRQGRGDEAVAGWEIAADAAPAENIVAHIELAKHYEWQGKDFDLALRWTDAAQARVQGWRAGLYRKQALAELEHRRQRLQRKMAASAGKTGG